MASIANAESGSSVRAKLNKVLGKNADDNISRSSLLGVDASRAGEKLRRKLRDIELGNEKTINILAVGDSLATTLWDTVNYQIQGYLKDWMDSSTFYGLWAKENVSGILQGAEAVGGPSANKHGKTKYAITWTGTCWFLNSTDTTFNYEGGNGARFHADKITVPVFRQSGGGSFKIEIDSGSGFVNPIADQVTSSHTLTGSELIVSSDGSNMDFVELTVAFGTWRVRVTHTSGGEVLLGYCCFDVTTLNAINSLNIAEGSNDFANETDTATTSMGQWIANRDPDIIVIESDDSLASYQNFLPKLDAAITAANLTAQPLVLLVGNPGIGSGFGATEANLATRIDYCWEYAAPRRWDVLDGLALFGGISALTEISWNADNVHLNSNVWREMARWWALDRGYAKISTYPPGGILASRQEILDVTSERPAQFTTEKYAPLEQSVLISALNAPIDTGWMTWTAGTAAGSGAASKTATRLEANSGSTANSTISLYPGTSDINFGFHNNDGRLRLDRPGAMTCQIVLDANTATGECHMIFDNGANAVAYRALASNGFGWRILNNVLDGVAWNGSLQTTSSVTLNGSQAYRLVVVWGIQEGAAGGQSNADFYVNDLYLGRAAYSTPAGRSFGINVTNGASGVQRLYIRPPQIIMQPAQNQLSLNP